MTKQEKIEEFLKQPLEVGNHILVKGYGSQNKESWGIVKVVEIKDGVPYIEQHRSVREVTEEWKKWTGEVGADPFDKSSDRLQSINFSLDSILFHLFKEDKYNIEGTPVKASNLNPFVFVDGEKKFYQRPFVWSLKDKQLLLESIYSNVDCGKILVRNRGWKELTELQKGGHELAWKDIVDGKQKLNAIKTFIEGEYPDLNGNYYGDLSDQAQRKLTNNQLISYSELPEDSKDEDVLRQFLRLNFTGIPQSEEHLEFIKSLIKQ